MGRLMVHRLSTVALTECTQWQSTGVPHTATRQRRRLGLPFPSVGSLRSLVPGGSAKPSTPASPVLHSVPFLPPRPPGRAPCPSRQVQDQRHGQVRRAAWFGRSLQNILSRIARSCSCSKIFRKCARSAMLFSLIPITSSPPMQRIALTNNGWFSNAGLSKLVLLKLSITAPQPSPAVGSPAALAHRVAAAPKRVISSLWPAFGQVARHHWNRSASRRGHTGYDPL
jgi:hypothetical protein